MIFFTLKLIVFILYIGNLKCQDFISSSVLVLTPHEWLCESSASQSIFVDFLDKKVYNGGDIRITIADKANEEDNFVLSRKVTGTGLTNIQFKIPDALKFSELNVTVQVVSANGKTRFIKSNTEVKCKITTGVYIITDKSVYREAEKVRIRIVSIDSSLKPLNQANVSLFIIDPNGNYVEQNEDLKFSNGLIDNFEFQITNRPIYGTWQIKLVTNSIEKTKEFEVKEYILPKIILNASVSKYSLISSPKVEGTIEAKYTYGKGADGEVKIEIESPNYSWLPKNATPSQVFYDKTTNGKLQFSYPLQVSDNFYYYTVKITFIDKLINENVTKQYDFSLYTNDFYINTEKYNFQANKTNSYQLTATSVFDNKPISSKEFRVVVVQKADWNSKPVSEKSYVIKTDLNGRFLVSFDVDEKITIVEMMFYPLYDANQKPYTMSFFKESIIDTPEIVDAKALKIEWLNPTEKLSKNDVVKLKFSGKQSDACYILRYLVLTKLSLVKFETKKICNTVNFDLNLNDSFGPSIGIVGYFVDGKNNVSTASLQLELSDLYSNHLNVTFGQDMVQPGQKVNITMNTKGFSVISLCIIDQSLELIGPTNELKANQIYDLQQQLRLNYFYQTFDNQQDQPDIMPFARIRPFYMQRPDALAELNSQGLVVFSDLKSLEPFMNNLIPLRPVAIDDQAFLQKEVGQPAGGSDNDQVRRDFREVWIWETFNNTNKENFTISSVIPDTITSWVVSGFSMNQKFGLALANKAKITTFKNFFVSMILPTSLTRGEIFILQVIVFNYYDFDLKNVIVDFKRTTNFNQVILNSKFENEFKIITSDIRYTSVTIPAGQARTFKFLISPKKIGSVKIAAGARSSIAGDTEERFIKVKAEGVERIDTKSFLFNLKSSTQRENVSISLPRNFVQGSESCVVQIIGDFLGTAFNNLNNLINKPYGCGEQNMLTLTPNIYALKYLKSMDSKVSNVEKLKNDAIDNIKYGYQNQLKYARKDGSFSAFGDSDASGSSWLTAFVVKSFAQANQFVSIDKNVINKAAEWLVAQQSKTGSFNEPGRVIHQDMQGGVNNQQTITAYITISLLEAQLDLKSVSSAILSAVAYLEQQMDLVKNDAYAIGLITYALHLANSKKAGAAFALLNSFSVKTSDGKMYLKTGSDSSEIELTSYGLLINLLRNDMSNAFMLARWLIGKSNSLGAYSSTQNTVLALQSLSEFGLKNQFGQSYSLKVTATVDASNTKTFTVNNQNMLILQQWKLPKCNGVNLRLNVAGTGSAFVQVITSYNVIQSLSSKRRIFNLSQTYESTSQRTLEIKTCVSSKASTGMVVIESGIFGGYEVFKQDLDLIREVKLAELSEDKTEASFYLDGFESDKLVEKCFKWKMVRSYPVSDIKPVVVRVYDYYDSSTEENVLFEYKEDQSVLSVVKEL